MVSIKQIKEMANSIDPSDYGYPYIGIRVQDDTYGAKIGKTVKHRSNAWDDGEMKRSKLSGVSAVCVPDFAYNTGTHDKFSGYSGNVVLVLGSNAAVYGDDENEIVMHNPVVLDIRMA